MDDFILNEETYYSPEANKRYLSFHQYISIAGGLLIGGCEAKAMAELNGEWQDPTPEAFIVGGYVDAFFDNSLDKFKAEHPEVFTQKGELKAPYKRAEKMIERCTRDELFMKFMGGKKQVIMTAYMFGCDWKCKLDSYIPGVAIVDLKTTSGMHKAWRINNLGYVSFVEAFSYEKQLAIYQKIVEINTGEHLPCYIAAVSKDDCPEIAIIEIDDFTLQNALNEIEKNMPMVLAVKNGETPPIRCECCDYCKSTKVLTDPINFRDLITETE